MLLELDTIWIVLAVTVVAILSYIVGVFFDALMRDDGFGATGNMMVMTGGFYAAVLGANVRGIRFDTLGTGVAAGLVGAFVAMSLLALAKAGLSRL
jgi:hypothetical protein